VLKFSGSISESDSVKRKNFVSLRNPKKYIAQDIAIIAMKFGGKNLKSNYLL
jgi:hypothetical protein